MIFHGNLLMFGPEVGWRFSPKKQWKPTKDPIDVQDGEKETYIKTTKNRIQKKLSDLYGEF